MRTSGFQIIALSLLGAVGVAACGADTDPAAGGVGLQLQIADGVQLNGLDYEVTGPSSFKRAGRVNLSGSNTISAQIGGLPAAVGYEIVLSSGSDSNVVCGGSARFDVMVGAKTSLVVKIRCKVPARTGSVLVNGAVNVCPVVDALSATPAEVRVGQTLTLTAAAVDLDGGPTPLTWTWNSAPGGSVQGTGATALFTCGSAGPTLATVTVSDGDCTGEAFVPLTCSPAAQADAGSPGTALVKINEIESNGGMPGDWVELVNAGDATADLSGWTFKDNDDTHVYTLPPGTSLAPGAYLLLEEAAFGFGLGGGDAARLFDGAGAGVDAHSWTSHASTTYGRCPNGSGPFVTSATVTKGGANDCGSAPAPDAGADGGGATLAAWPDPTPVTNADPLNQFGSNLSGLTFQPAADGAPPVLWAVQNGPGVLYRLQEEQGLWKPASGEWALGKNLRYPDGTGNPDAEGVTKAEWALPAAYVSVERNNDANNVSRLSVLRFNTEAVGPELVATHEWQLTADLPVVGPNLGLEAITWVPDSYLVNGGFIDQSTGQAYDPSRYPDHAGGLFLVGMEGTGAVYAYVLNHGGGFQRVATITTGFAGVMSLEFDRELGVLWAGCDNSCGNKMALLALDTTVGSPTRGRFVVRGGYQRPTTLPDVNNEGIAFAPVSSCASGQRLFFWSDDDRTGGHALRVGAVPCVSPF